ncbi:procollagen galactosyltransferase 1 [Aplysia californica]|uniref:Procollagen galactosyltransferase 1 n=1 Tax=Aplysia californica TaxID=6500 RepID=A0ABM1AD75_APLCA|nr:procollagen galactosyltransferase 1 [Aplysia californica]
MATPSLTCWHLYSGTCLILVLVMFNDFNRFSYGRVSVCHAEEFAEDDSLLPTVLIATLVRNKEHSLPWFLGLIERLDYPKDRIALWIQSDHNVDNSTAILREWLAAVSKLYHSVEVGIDDKQRGYTDEESPCEWTEKRFSNVIKHRQKALKHARKIWADYLFMIDADVTLENDRTLQILMEENKLVIGPMLNSSVEGYYSNFWAGMSDKGYYMRANNYMQIVEREMTGTFPVPMVHTALLVDLRHPLSSHLAYSPPPPDYKGPRDDIIIFAHSVKALGQTMHVTNTAYFGKVMIPLDKRYSLEDEYDQFEYVKLEAMVEEVPPLYSSPHVYVPERAKDKLGFDQIYMINLKRRPARRFRMTKAFDYLGIDAKYVDAVDGKELNDTFLEQKGIEMLPGFADPYHGRPMTMGEIGCFLSHYQIWEEVVAKNYQKVIVFEDDVRFEPYFRKKLGALMYEVEEKFDVWDLIYLGRKRLRKDLEFLVEGSQRLAWPHYSYWTISYLLSNHGAHKLLDQKPLSKMVPVDEYLPIMFDRHPEDSWRLKFWPRDMVSLSADPFLLYPTHYTGEPHYFSDTEDSVVIEKWDTAEQEVGQAGAGDEGEMSPPDGGAEERVGSGEREGKSALDQGKEEL